MTRPSRRDVERAVEDLENGSGDDVTLERDVHAGFVTFMADECMEDAEASFVVVDAEGEVVERPGDGTADDSDNDPDAVDA